MTKYKLVFIELPREKGRLIPRIYRRFRVKILMRSKKYPGFLLRKAPYLTIQEFGRGVTAFEVNGTLFSQVLIVPEYIIEELSEQLDRVGIKYLPEGTANIDVLSISFDKRMKAMKRFWNFYEPKEKLRFKEFVLDLSSRIRKSPSNKLVNKLLEDSLWVLDIAKKIEQIDWTRKRCWGEKPEFTKTILETAISTVRKCVTEKFYKGA